MNTNIQESRDTASLMNSWFNEYGAQFRELMAYYRCALMEVTTKFQVMNEELSLRYDRNPIESIKGRIKEPQSILDKLKRKGFDISIKSIERNLDDVAGVRIICSFPSDIYLLSDALLRQDDIILIEKKDYVKDPKPNGYRSLHLIIALPIFLHDHKKMMTVELQFRTIAMDWWASLEHKIRYKKDLAPEEEIDRELLELAETSAELDQRMERIMEKVEWRQVDGDRSDPD